MLAPRWVAIVRRPSGLMSTAIAPVGSAAHTARTSTPFDSRSATRRRPVSSSPTRVTRRDASPSEAVHAQKFAAPERDRGGGVVVRLERAVGHDPDIEHEVADGDDQDLTRIAAQGTSIAV